MSGSSSWYATTLPKLWTAGIVVIIVISLSYDYVVIEMFLVCHIIKQGYVIKSSGD